jgi:hypothetical protein
MSKLSHVFDFDSEILTSKVYERLFRSSLKQQVAKQQPLRLPTEDNSSKHKPRSKEYFLLLGEDPYLRSYKDSLQCAVHPTDCMVLTMQDSDPRALLRLGSEKAPLAFVCAIESSCKSASLEATAEYLSIFQRGKLPTSPPLYVILLVKDDPYPLEKNTSVSEQTIEMLLNVTEAPFRWFVVHVKDRKRADQCMRELVTETYAEHGRRLGPIDVHENGIVRKDTMMETQERDITQTKEQILTDIEEKIMEELSLNLAIERNLFGR